MPNYAYLCDNCKFEFTANLSVANRHDPTLFPCTECNEYMIRKQIGCAGFVLKGYCWSRDNYSRTLGDDPRGHFQQDRSED